MRQNKKNIAKNFTKIALFFWYIFRIYSLKICEAGGLAGG